MESPRAIVHFDLDAFYCSVEILRQPALKDKPVVVGGKPEERGVVAAASYKAREFGIHSAMSMFQAQKLCKNLVILPMQRPLYQMYSRIVMGILKTASPVIEQVSIDEAYLDFTSFTKDWHAVIPTLRALQTKIRRDIGLGNSMGFATNKMVAKIASDYHKPNGLTIVEPGEEAAFLAPLTVRKIPGIGPKMSEKLEILGIQRVGELAKISPKELEQKFGKWGIEMARWANGIDDRPVMTERETKSISQERTFVRDISDPDELDGVLVKLCSILATQLLAEKVQALTIQIKLRWPDFSTVTRQLTLTDATNAEAVLIQAARTLLSRVWLPGNPVRLFGVGCSNLKDAGGQLTIPGLN
ncbi:MAG TPA: DNA polymerase IV [Candidatus Marinimicrobia bacterium]|nr:MAG: hypothetical protein AUJ47_13315 [Candidatus Marinimicrobia bacterium CG1_02_48_14]PJA52103.1 MAG: DNA polymerase IV [Candidatus Marinimicrobia bacterium CG_4_9_14_3_um_filter_48_9]HCW75139.1 DNA polymerase IV [Candidatus Neomarinimicrobiota bacterium]